MGGGGSRGARAPLKFGGKYFSGNYHVIFGYFSGKNHVKLGNVVNFSGNSHVQFWHFVNFSDIFFGQKCLAPLKLTKLLRLCVWWDL